MRFIIALAALAIATPVSAGIEICPGAYVDFERWERSIDRQPPVQVLVRARSALNECRKQGLPVPRTVKEYNNEPSTITIRELEKQINPLGRDLIDR